MNTISKYLKTYFLPDAKEIQAQKEEKIDKIRVQEIIEEEEEATPDQILERLWEEEM